MGNNANNKEVTVISEKKVNMVLGIIHLLIVAVIIGLNLYFRFTDVHRGDGYEHVPGVITKREEQYTKIGRRTSSKTWITVRYKPKGTDRDREYSGTDFSYGFLYQGTVVRVYYKDNGDDPRNVFIARYDWLVRDYLPADKSYNIPLIVAGVLLIIGIYYFTDNRKPKKKNSGNASNNVQIYLEDQRITIDPATGKMYEEGLHDLARFANRRRGWKRFWIAGSFGFTVFTAMGIMMMAMTLREYGGDKGSVVAGLAFSGFIMIIGIGFVPLTVTTMVKLIRQKNSFISAFMNDPETATYSDRENAAKTLWKLASHYMEKETPWSRYKLEYSRFWLDKYRNNIEKFR